jgi:hypothetical protein
MSPANLLFVAIGAVSLLLGLGILVTAIRGAPGTDPRSTALLIGGMMITAFGLLMAGFAIAYSTGEPPDLNAKAPQ